MTAASVWSVWGRRLARGFENRPTLLLYLAATLASLLASALMVFADPLVNADGVLYLRMARAYVEQGYEAAMALYPRPFYSVVIAWVHQATGAPLLTAAHLLNAGLCAALVCGFVALVTEMGARSRGRWLALLVIMLLPQLNEYRHYVARDFGYWAFGVWSVVVFCRWWDDRRVWGAVSWIALVAVAALFRPEAIALFLLPLCGVFGSAGRRGAGARVSVRGLVVAVMTMGLVGIGLAWLGPDLRQGAFGEPLRSLAMHLQGLFQLRDQIPDKFGAQLFGRDVAVVGYPGLLLVAVYIVLAHALEALGWPALVGIAGTWFAARKRAFPWRHLVPVLWVVAIQAVVLLVVALDRLLLQSRHCMMMVFMLASLLPFLLDRLLSIPRQDRTRARRVGLAVIFAYLAVDSFVSFGSSKAYVLDAARWLQIHTPADSVVHTNSVQIAWYSNRPVDWDGVLRLQRGGPLPPSARFDYLALVVKGDGAAALTAAENTFPELVVKATLAGTGRGRVVILGPPPASAPP